MSTTLDADGNFDYFTQGTFNVQIQLVEQDVNFTPLKSLPANLTVEILWVNQPPVFGPRGLAGYTSTIPELSVRFAISYFCKS